MGARVNRTEISPARGSSSMSASMDEAADWLYDRFLATTAGRAA